MKKTLIEQLELNKAKHELLASLLLVAQENWEAAYTIAQRKEGELLYDQVHALLHRIEGDTLNANYWYKRINKPYGVMSIEEEWNELAAAYLKELT